jgi:hypothetical protein
LTEVERLSALIRSLWSTSSTPRAPSDAWHEAVSAAPPLAVLATFAEVVSRRTACVQYGVHTVAQLTLHENSLPFRAQNGTPM